MASGFLSAAFAEPATSMHSGYTINKNIPKKTVFLFICFLPFVGCLCATRISYPAIARPLRLPACLSPSASLEKRSMARSQYHQQPWGFFAQTFWLRSAISASSLPSASAVVLGLPQCLIIVEPLAEILLSELDRVVEELFAIRGHAFGCSGSPRRGLAPFHRGQGLCSMPEPLIMPGPVRKPGPNRDPIPVRSRHRIGARELPAIASIKTTITTRIVFFIIFLPQYR